MLAIGISFLLMSVHSVNEPFFKPNEVQEIQKYWAKPDRYTIGVPDDAAKVGLWQARQTAEGSVWLLNYYKARGNAGKILPTADPAAINPAQAAWDKWIEAKYDFDQFQSDWEAHEKNKVTATMRLQPVDPGVVPPDLVALAGEPPRFVSCVQPKQFTITFEDITLKYQDFVKIRRKYAYFRFTDGVNSEGVTISTMSADELTGLFKQAGLGDAERKIMQSVSLLEGGFDSINTYDTGYVSVGFIQFASLGEGGGSLGEMMLRYKTSDPVHFQQDLRRFGLDVTPENLMVALDPASGKECIGPAANDLIIRDKRLIAAFQRAGLKSSSFKAAQIRAARDMFYPASMPITATLGAVVLHGKVSDVFKTEAGLATLMDRRVNTGKMAGLDDAISNLMQEYGFTTLAEVSQLEYQLTRMMKYRVDFLAQANDLSKPRDVTPNISRSGKRGSTGGGTGG